LTRGTFSRFGAFAAGLLAALGIALAADGIFRLQASAEALDSALANLAALAICYWYGRLEPAWLAALFRADEKTLRRRLWLELTPLLLLFLLRHAWEPALPALRTWLPVAAGLRCVSVWAARPAPKKDDWWLIFLAAPALLFAAGFLGRRSLFLPLIMGAMLATGWPFTGRLRRWCATEGMAALPAILPLFLGAACGRKWLGAAGLVGWAVGRLWAYPRWLERRGYGWVMLIGCGLVFWLGELALSASPLADALATPHLTAAVESHDTLFWINKETFRGTTDFGVARVKIRGRETPTEKTPGVERVLCCGGSTTYGVDLPLEQTWVHLAEQRLLTQGRRCELLNAGEAGYTAFQIKLLLEHFLVPDYRPDGVILYLGYNDGNLARGPYTERELYRMWQAYRAGGGNLRLRLGQAFRGYRLYNLWSYLLRGVRRRYGPSQVTLSSSAEFSQTLAEMLAYLKEKKIRVLLVAEASQVDSTLYRRIMAEQAAAHDAAFLDVHEIIRRQHSAADIFTDVVHLTPRGNRIVAELIADAWLATENRP